MNKELFVKWVNAVKTQQDSDQKIYDAFKGANDTYWMGGVHNDLGVVWDRIMEDIFGEETHEMIMWWMYDQDFGTDAIIYDGETDEVLHTLDTPEALWDYMESL